MRAPLITDISRIVALGHDTHTSLVDQIVLFTSKSHVVLRCNQDTDEIVISRQRKRKREGLVIVAGRFHVVWTWVFVNQQGYADGFRIQLENRGVTRVFDFVAIASSIEVREAKPMQANQALQPTRVLVTCRADARPAPSTRVADL